MTRVERIVDAIWTEELSFSDLPERLHSEIKVQVPVKSYFKGGVFDEPAFRVAVESEIREWDRLLTPHVMGTGFTASRDLAGRLIKGQKALEKEDEKWVEEMLLLGGQPD